LSRFAFATCSRAFGITNTLNVGDARWDSFQKAIEMRNRITHPRTPEDLHLSDEDFEQIKLALFWFSENQLVRFFVESCGSPGFQFTQL